MKLYPYHLWIDLETSGSKADTHHLLEVGWAITGSGPSFPLKSEPRANVLHFDRSMVSYLIHPTVEEMHTKNGLWEECLKSRMTEDRLDNLIVDLIKQVGIKTHTIMISGAGVSHFDGLFIRKFLPKVNNFCTYPYYDIRMLDRALAMLGHDIIPEHKTHRGKDDIFGHLMEARTQMDTLKEWKQHKPPLL